MLSRIFYEVKQDIWYQKSIVYRRKLLTTGYQKGEISTQLGGYSISSMLQHNLLFVHVPKCAGTYINQTLFGSLGGGHLRACDYLRMLGRRKFNSLESFAVMRNPWERLYSAYRHMCGKAFRSEMKKKEFRSFEQFVNDLKSSDIYKTLVLHPQYLFLTERYVSNKVLVKTIWDQTDIEKLLRQYGYDGMDSNKESNSSGERVDIHDLYSKKMRRKVSELYEKDIIVGGYVF